jgi:hypothetical protein
MPGRNDGFILLYTLWMLVALIALLAALPKIGVRGGNALTVDAALEQRQIVNVLDYVLRYSRPFHSPQDPRFSAYMRVLQAQSDQKNATDDRLAVLKALLDAMNFKINLPQGKNPTSPQATTDSDTSAPGKAKGTGDNQHRIFFPSKEAYRIQLDGTEFTIRVQPTNRKPNLNRLPRDPLLRYLLYLGLPRNRAEGLADVIRDWIDEDDIVSFRGAEADYYKYKSRPPYLPRNGPIQTWQELLYLKDMTQGQVDFLRQHFTLYGVDATVLVDGFPPEAIAALANLPLATVRNIIANHAKPPEAQGADTLTLKDEDIIFSTVATWAPESRWMGIRIESAHAAVEAVYDTKLDKIIDWHLD